MIPSTQPKDFLIYKQGEEDPAIREKNRSKMLVLMTSTLDLTTRSSGLPNAALALVLKYNTIYNLLNQSNNNQFLHLLIESKITKMERKRGIGRKKMSWLQNIRQWTGLHGYYIQSLIHTARNRGAMENVSQTSISGYALEEEEVTFT